MTGHSLGARLLVYGLLGTSFALGLPLFHYVTALMIALVLRHGRGPDGLLTAMRAGATRVA
ncbi:MAG: hypothetical protein WD314_00805 [Trueperaceae bacterium]